MSLEARFHLQVTALKVLFCSLLSPLALVGLVSSVLLGDSVFAQLLVQIPSLSLISAEGVTDGDLSNDKGNSGFSLVTCAGGN